jgi:tyrosyl-tRNA synthetase
MHSCRVEFLAELLAGQSYRKNGLRGTVSRLFPSSFAGLFSDMVGVRFTAFSKVRVPIVNHRTLDLIVDLRERGLVAQMSSGDELAEHLRNPRRVYCGFDPTADSLHIGSLVPLLALRRFQLAGHAPIALVGGATGLIGDPSHKAEERQLNAADVVAGWSERLKAQLARFVDFDTGSASATVVNNLDWMAELSALDFLRDVGKHFSVNAMINKESVRQRLERNDVGISFTEFSYLLLQSYDFAELYRRYGCTVQVGGSDQWGNITGGIDLARRLHRATVYGLTLPLVTKADGTKFGKTESGTVWLDPSKTSPYTFYQFWVNTPDADVYRFLRYFTFLPVAEIAAIEQADAETAGRRMAQQVLAKELTELVHGRDAVAGARRIVAALFEGGGALDLTEHDFAQLKQDGLGCAELDRSHLREQTFTQILVGAGVTGAGKQIKDALARGVVTVNDRVLSPADNVRSKDVFDVERSLFGRFYLVRIGKKQHHLLEVTGEG